MTPEGKVEHECLRYLNENGWLAVSTRTQGIYDERSGGYRPAGPFVYRGWPDALAIKNGMVLFIEFKAARGVQSNEQRLAQKAIEERGHTYLLIRSKDEIIKAVEQFEAYKKM